MALGALPNELLLLLFSLLRQKDACRLSQASRIWHQRVEEHLPERQHAWRHGVALLSWAERAVKRVRHRRQQSRQRVSMVMHSFAPVQAPAQLLQMASSRVHSSVSSLCAAFTSAAASLPDVAPGNCCGTMVAARSSDDLWEHLQTVHGVGRDAYMVRARALQWGV